jgi:hypothetical protein
MKTNKATYKSDEEEYSNDDDDQDDYVGSDVDVDPVMEKLIQPRDVLALGDDAANNNSLSNYSWLGKATQELDCKLCSTRALRASASGLITVRGSNIAATAMGTE